MIKIKSAQINFTNNYVNAHLGDVEDVQHSCEYKIQIAQKIQNQAAELNARDPHMSVEEFAATLKDDLQMVLEENHWAAVYYE